MAGKTEGMDPVPEPPFTYEEYLNQKRYEFWDITVFNQDGERLRMQDRDETKAVFAVKDMDLSQLSIFMTNDEEQPLVKVRDIDEIEECAELIAVVDVDET